MTPVRITDNVGFYSKNIVNNVGIWNNSDATNSIMKE